MKDTRLKAFWLIGFIALVLIMISVGGATRLTRSGLSIVEWNPVVGSIPPLTEQDWQSQFDLYKGTPEYQKVNSHFELDDYKKIFIWEYLHRLLGRVIFLFVLIPGIYLWRRKIVEGRLVVLLATLIAGQGLVGWLMVKTGLNHNPHVSPLMLALHFILAVGVLGTAYYHLSKMRKPLPLQEVNFEKKFLLINLGALLFIQVFYGCLTSGLKAGLYYNTFPLMGNRFLPPSGLSLLPVWTNFFENPVTVQWIHRWLGVLILTCILMTARSFLKVPNSPFKGPFIHLIGITSVQVILGILNLILSVPILLAVAHQLIAALIILGYLNVIFRMQLRSSHG